jgi:hypothetical protein
MNNPPEPYDAERHHAWLDSLSRDEALVVYTPQGYLMTFIIVALTKRALLMDEIKPAEQLRLLEKLNGLTDGYFTPEMLAAVEPMSDIECKIFEEAKSLDPAGDKSSRASFGVLTSPRVFWHLATLNPSLLSAIKLREGVGKLRGTPDRASHPY